MRRLMLDTNVCIHVIKGDVPLMRRHLEGYRPSDVAISSVVEAELWFGVMKSDLRERNQRSLEQFLTVVTVLDWPRSAGPLYGELRARLEAKGRRIGALDELIAAHALYEHAALATRNRREFERIEGLKLALW